MLRTVAVSMLTVGLAWASPAISAPIDFNDFTLNGVSGQDKGGTATVLDGGATLKLEGNTWKYIELPAELHITAEKIIRLDFRADAQGEIQGVLLGNEVEEGRAFDFYGTQGWGATDEFRTYTAGDEGTYVSYEIPVGDYVSEGYPFTALSFMGDHDDPPGDQVGHFRNVEIIPEPASAVILGVCGFGSLIRRARRR